MSKLRLSLLTLAEVSQLTLAELEEVAIREAHRRTGGKRSAMMRYLGLSKSSLIRKLDALGLRAAELAAIEELAARRRAEQEEDAAAQATDWASDGRDFYSAAGL